MEIKKYHLNPKLMLLNGVLVKNDTLDRMFELDEELEGLADYAGVIQCEAVAELGYLSNAQLSKVKVGETKELINMDRPAGYRVTRLSKHFCIVQMLEMEFVFNENYLYQGEQQEEEQQEEEVLYEFC